MAQKSKKTSSKNIEPGKAQFIPCCQTGDKVCGKEKTVKTLGRTDSTAQPSQIQTAPKPSANIKRGDKEWVYTNTVRDHFFNPRNLLSPEEEASYEADGMGEVGSPACGDVMKIWIRVDEVREGTAEDKEAGDETTGSGAKDVNKAGNGKADAEGAIDLKKSRIKECKWQTFGCGSAIASTSMMSEMVTEKGGMTLENAMNLKAMDINERLGGLPNIKLHCSVLGDQALKAAIEDYLSRA